MLQRSSAAPGPSRLLLLGLCLLAPAAAAGDESGPATPGGPVPAPVAGPVAGPAAGPAAGAVAGVAAQVAQEAGLLAIEGPLPAGLAEQLTRHTAFHGDYGTIAVAQAPPTLVVALARRGVRAVSLGPWPDGTDLIVVHAEPDAPGAPEALPADGRILFATSRQALVAVPAGSLGGLACHHGAAVPRAAFRPGRGFTGGAPTLAAALAADPRIAALVAQVNQAKLLATVTQLSSYFTRRADSSLVLQARDWIVGQVNALGGWSVTSQSFSGSYGPNIVAERVGSVHPERLVILGAHYDSINHSGASLAAPGADDNATGSAGILEAARLLSQASFENTVRCVWFCAEEEGLIGSDAMAAALDTQNAQVVAMLNMDMIAHLEAGDARDLDFATNSTDPALTQFCRDITAAYVPSLATVTGVLTAGSSDHAPFSQHGFPAAFYFEDLTEYSHALHTVNDALPGSPNDFGLAADITRSFVAAAASLAAPVDMTLQHVPLADTADAGGPYPLAVTAASLTPATVASVDAFVTVNGGAPSQVTLLPGLAPGQWVGSLPGSAPLATVDYWLLATDTAGNQQWLPEGVAPGAASFSFKVAVVTTFFTEGFEGANDAGWTHGAASAQDDWQRGVPQGKAGDPAAAAQGLKVWGTDLGPSGWNGGYGPNADSWLESPAIDCSGRAGVHLRYARWLTVEEGFYDLATVAVDGTTVWQNPITGNLVDTAWMPQALDISGLADNDPAVRLRFQLDADGLFELGGWNVDDVRLVTETAASIPALTVSALHLPAAAGGALSSSLDAGPALAGRKYVLALSASGSSPGTPLGSVVVPLHFDALTPLGFNLLNTPVLPGGAGILSAQGKATAGFVSPPLPGLGLAGVHVSFAFLTLGPIDFASNAVTVEYVP